jgi:hypothetical protein
MAGMLRPLKLIRKVRSDTGLGKIDPEEYAPGLYRSIGNVTYSILPRRKKPHLVKFILEERITGEDAEKVAERLANLGPVNTLFTFEVYANAAIIPYFTDAASLNELLDVWPFDPEHSKILASDVSCLEFRISWADGVRSWLVFQVCIRSGYREVLSATRIYFWSVVIAHCSSK